MSATAFLVLPPSASAPPNSTAAKQATLNHALQRDGAQFYALMLTRAQNWWTAIWNNATLSPALAAAGLGTGGKSAFEGFRMLLQLIAAQQPTVNTDGSPYVMPTFGDPKGTNATFENPIPAGFSVEYPTEPDGTTPDGTVIITEPA